MFVDVYNEHMIPKHQTPVNLYYTQYSTEPQELQLADLRREFEGFVRQTKVPC